MIDIRVSVTQYRAAANVYRTQRDALRQSFEDSASKMNAADWLLKDLRRDLDAMAATVAPIEAPDLIEPPAQPDRD